MKYRTNSKHIILARATLKRITVERVMLYSRVPSPGDSIPVDIEHFALEGRVSEEGEVEWAVKRLQTPGGHHG